VGEPVRGAFAVRGAGAGRGRERVGCRRGARPGGASAERAAVRGVGAGRGRAGTAAVRAGRGRRPGSWSLGACGRAGGWGGRLGEQLRFI